MTFWDKFRCWLSHDIPKDAEWHDEGTIRHREFYCRRCGGLMIWQSVIKDQNGRWGSVVTIDTTR